MAPKWRFVSLALIFILPLGVTFLSREAVTAPNSYEVLCQPGTISTPLRNHHVNNNVVLPVNLHNVSDSIVGFTLWIRSAWPELLRFRADSTVGDVIYAKFDTVNTRSRGFKFFSARIQDAMHGQVKISAICDSDSPRVVKPIPPGNGVLLKLIMESTEADSICDSIRQKTFGLQIDKAQTSFSNSAGQTIGCIYELEIDTAIGEKCCTNWNSDYTVCLRHAPPDSVCITERLRCVSIDETKLMLLDGSNTFHCLPPCQCGDANSDGAVDISDVVFVIAYIFSGGTAPGTCVYAKGQGDANADGTVDVSDCVFLIAYIFSGGQAPHCH